MSKYHPEGMSNAEDPEFWKTLHESMGFKREPSETMQVMGALAGENVVNRIQNDNGMPALTRMPDGTIIEGLNEQGENNG